MAAAGTHSVRSPGMPGSRPRGMPRGAPHPPCASSSSLDSGPQEGPGGMAKPLCPPRDQLLIPAPQNSQHTSLSRCLTKRGGSGSCTVTRQDEPPARPAPRAHSPRYLPGTIRARVTAAGWPQSLPAVPAALLGSCSPVPRVPQQHRPCQPAVQTEPRHTPGAVLPAAPGTPPAAPRCSPGHSLRARAWGRPGSVRLEGEKGP